MPRRHLQLVTVAVGLAVFLTLTPVLASSELIVPATQKQTISGFKVNDSFKFILACTGTEIVTCDSTNGSLVFTSFDYIAHGMPYLYSESVPGNHDHAWWEDGDREGYRCGYAFLYDKHPNPFGSFSEPRPAKFIAQAVVARATGYAKINDKYMEEGERYFDGTIADEGRREIQDPNEASDCALEASLLVPGFDYDTYVPHGEDEIRVGLFRADGEIADIRDFTDLAYTNPGHFEFVSFDGNLVQIVFVPDQTGKATHAIYYRTMNDGRMAVEVNGTSVHPSASLPPAPSTTLVPTTTTTTTIPPTTTTVPTSVDPRCEVDNPRPRCQTTTVPTTTTTIPGSSTGASIGVVGCSNTEDSIENSGGYLTQSSKDLLAGSASGGGSLSRWATNSRGHWDIYDSMRPSGGYSSVWFQLCVRTGEGSGTYEQQMDSVLNQIRDRDPGATVLVSWLNHYTFDTCPQVDWGAEDRLLDYAASLGLVAGPWLGPLNQGQVRRDNCHPSSAGSSFLGGQLVDFFD